MNCSIQEIDTAFNQLISKRGAFKQLGVTCDHLKYVRKRLRQRKPFNHDIKVAYLMRSGWRPEVNKMYTQEQVVYLIDKAIKLNQESRAMGGAFVLELLLAKAK
jgi:hypothetical protein